MKKILISILLLFPLVLLSQDSLKLRRISIGAIYSPDLCNRILKYPSSSKWIEEMRNETERPMFGFVAGLGFKIKLLPKLLLETGAYYTIKGQQTTINKLV